MHDAVFQDGGAQDDAGVHIAVGGKISDATGIWSPLVMRTAVLKDGVMHVQAGAGLVADSVPKMEQAECLNKARALFKAADEAVRFAAGPLSRE